MHTCEFVELRNDRSCFRLRRYIFIRPSSWSPISGQFSRNDGRSWQTGCPEITGNDTDAGSWTEYVGLSEIGERVSLSHLCNVLQWYQVRLLSCCCRLRKICNSSCCYRECADGCFGSFGGCRAVSFSSCCVSCVNSRRVNLMTARFE